MGTGRKFNKKPKTRPKKNLAERRRRVRTQKRRLTQRGMDSEAVEKMNSKQVRTALRRAG